MNSSRNNGSTMLFVMAALIVIGFLGSAMLKLSSSEQLNNVQYFGSSKARSTAKSGDICSRVLLESPALEQKTIDRLQAWITAAANGTAPTLENQWITGTALTNWYTSIAGEASEQYATRILAFDHEQMNVTLATTSNSRSGRAEIISVYHLSGPVIEKPEMKINAFQADGGIHEGNFESLTIHGNTSIRWAGEFSKSSLNGKVTFNGTFRSDDLNNAFVVNNFYRFGGETYIANLGSQAGGTAEFTDKTMIEREIAQGGKKQLVEQGTFVHSHDELGLPLERDPPLQFDRSQFDAFSGTIRITDHVLGGSTLNQLWEHAQKNGTLWENEYLVLRVGKGGSPRDFFYDDGVAFRYQVIIIAEGNCRLTTFYRGEPTSKSLVYVHDYPYEGRTFTNISDFYGIIYVNAVKNDPSTGFALGRQDLNLSKGGVLPARDDPRFQFTLHGALYCGERAKVRFEGVNVWAPRPTLLNKDFLIGIYTINFNESIVKAMLSKELVTLPQVKKEASKLLKGGPITLQLVSQSI